MKIALNKSEREKIVVFVAVEKKKKMRKKNAINTDTLR